MAVDEQEAWNEKQAYHYTDQRADSGLEPLITTVPPTTFYSHIKKGEEAEECERRKVIKDFCFPNGVEMKSIKTFTELRRALNPSDHEQTFFAFTLNS